MLINPWADTSTRKLSNSKHSCVCGNTESDWELIVNSVYHLIGTAFLTNMKVNKNIWWLFILPRSLQIKNINKSLQGFLEDQPRDLTVYLPWKTVKEFSLQFWNDINITEMRIRKMSIRGLLVDPMPIFPNQHHKNCVADSQENY